jgi:hypothetical protein
VHTALYSAACLEQLVSEVASTATGFDWDVCTVEFYGPYRYNAGAPLAGNDTHFEPGICIVSAIILQLLLLVMIANG